MSNEPCCRPHWQRRSRPARPSQLRRWRPLSLRRHERLEEDRRLFREFPRTSWNAPDHNTILTILHIIWDKRRNMHIGTQWQTARLTRLQNGVTEMMVSVIRSTTKRLVSKKKKRKPITWWRQNTFSQGAQIYIYIIVTQFLLHFSIEN